MPDITPDPGQPAVIAKASIEAGLSMPLFEVAARAAIEIALIILAARVVIAFVHKLGQKASKVCLHLTRP